MKTMYFELVPVSPARAFEEDWYIRVNGVSRGYLYRSAGGYAVGITVQDKVKYFSVEPTKAAATTFAEKALADVRVKVADADHRGNDWLAKARQAEERGNQKRAEECYRKGQYWLDRSNKLRGEC